MKINKTLKIFLSMIILMLFFNINFRFTNSINCCSDDFDYFIHAETISQDFDFDYSNQLKGYEKSRFYKNGKSAPVGYVGSGLLASPFMFFGKKFIPLDILSPSSPFTPKSNENFLEKLDFESLSLNSEANSLLGSTERTFFIFLLIPNFIISPPLPAPISITYPLILSIKFFLVLTLL